MKGRIAERAAEPYARQVDEKKLQGLLDKLNTLALPDAEERSKALASVFGDVPVSLDRHSEELPGPTGELNKLTNHARGGCYVWAPMQKLHLNRR
jgi:RHH-type proline utilization regulon transcriptional repressor/proline dehydrogenase/delta 1-pyrroline-5-carboxylate dehydrogenase